MSQKSETQSLDRRGGEPPGSERLRVLAFWDDQHLIHLLPERGTVTVGRGEGVEFQITDRAISRQHVRIHVTDWLCVEDLGSANGTFVRGRSLKPGETVEVQPGDMIELGRTMLFIQRAPSPVRPVQLYTHDYFEARLDDECGRSERGGRPFSVVRVHHPRSPGTQVEEILAASVQPGDVLGRYGPGEHELLWVDCSPEATEERAGALVTSLREAFPAGSVGVACSPRDGRRAAELLERANAAVRGPGKGERSTSPMVLDGTMESLRRIVERVAGSSISVLFTGETGVGKGVLAAELHQKSPRSAGPFVTLNCAALTESLLEAELFGYEKGSFTGAVKAKPGLLETADGGTLLLDEVGEMSLGTQAKLLGALEDRKFLRVGGVRPRQVDLRLVSCTNRDLEVEIERGTFRKDLFFRLAQLQLVVPPLRERKTEIDQLAVAFAAQAGLSSGLKRAPVISPQALAELRRHPWIGNVRELRNVIERAVLFCADGVIRPEDVRVDRLRTTVFPPTNSTPGNLTPQPPLPAEPEPGDPSDQEERKRIREALEACGGNQTKAAKLLGYSRRTLVNRLEKLRMPRPRKPGR